MLTFRYSSRTPYFIYYRTVYHFITGPGLQAGKLVWDHSCDGHHLHVAVDCPVPPPTGPLLPLSY